MPVAIPCPDADGRELGLQHRQGLIADRAPAPMVADLERVDVGECAIGKDLVEHFGFRITGKKGGESGR